MELTQEFVKSLFYYQDGELFWKHKRSNFVPAGRKAGCIRIWCGRKRNCIRIGYKAFYSARLIFLFHHGWLPEVVDHENRNPLDDRIENLRAADIFKNNRNRSSMKNSASVYLGVDNDKGKWRARIQHNKLGHKLGYFEKEEEAALAYNRAAVMYHGEFANLNIINANQ